MKLPVNKPFSSTSPDIVLDGDLSVGIHRFLLVVENESGLLSKSAEINVEIIATDESPKRKISVLGRNYGSKTTR